MPENQVHNTITNATNNEGVNKYIRFKLPYRIEHWIFITSFLTLGLTGLVQKYAEAPISQSIVRSLGGIENTRMIHHFAAIVMMLVAIYHIGALAYRVYVLRYRMSMLPTLGDLRSVIGWLAYYFGLSKNSPQEGRYTYAEKLEYWAVVWGTVVMAVTGYMMWNPISTARFLPGEFIPAAKVAHGLEAVLAVLSIFIWHFYHVLIRHFNKSMFTGYVSEEMMLEEHPLELADIKAGTARRPVTPGGIRRRSRIFWPTYSVFAVIMLAGVYLFVNYEETAITTIPPASDETVFVPLTPTPLPTPLPTATPLPTPTPLPEGESISWDSGVADLLEQKCSACHNSNNKIGGLDLSNHESTLLGGNSGPAVVPGDPNSSQIIIVQSAGGHPGQLSPEELESIIQWIEDDAPEN